MQDLVNGIDWIKEKLHEKTCIDLDIDRQSITTFGTPKQIDELIKVEVTKLGSKQGGLMMVYGLYPNVLLKMLRQLWMLWKNMLSIIAKKINFSLMLKGEALLAELARHQPWGSPFKDYI